MNRQAKSAIKTLVLTLRHKLEDEIEIQLKRYGFSGERWLLLERLPHIQRDDGATIEHFRLKAALEQHLRRIGTEPDGATAEQRAEAAGWFVREVAFTHLNRLVALKCLEVRELIPEIITTRDAYGGRSQAHYDYRNAHPDEANRPDGALPAAIKHAARGVYAEFKFLFDVGDPTTGRQPPAEAILWPSYPVLKECITLVNNLDANAENTGRSLWAEDEIIGWFYQFYNAEHKEAVRKRGRPRRPAEVAVINQFFTPRWIVKFLVDNTLGRLWLEMHPDSERVRAKCDYLVPEPLSAEGDQITLDPDSPINDPGAPARREPKRPQDLRLIDPACGTMHFGHYAFEVFQEIYRDARERGWVHGEDALPDKETPAAILRHNLYGVDIDLRAVQLAGLSLFMKAKTANPKAHISRVNLVVADAVLPADGARQQFLDQYRDDKVVQGAVHQVLDEMANVAEVGSLLRVEQRLQDILGQAGHAAVTSAEVVVEQPRQLVLAEAPGVSPEGWGAHYTLARLLGDLRDYSAHALQTHNLNAQLFAEEAEKSVKLLDVFLNDYDAVVMNPPYGRTLDGAQAYLGQVYPVTKNDLFMAFVERAQDLLKSDGFVGALVSKTFFTLQRGRGFRKQILFEKSTMFTCLDLGMGVLDDATVETTAFVCGMPKMASSNQIGFVDLLTTADKEDGFVRFLETGAFGHWTQQAELERLPGAALIYKLPTSVERLFAKCPPLDLGAYTRVYKDAEWDAEIDQLAYVRSGLVPPSYAQFVHYRWESSPQHSDWVRLAKGGDFRTYYADIEYSIWWKDNGKDAKRYSAEHYGSASRYIKNERLFFREGVTYSRVSSVGLSGRYLPEGCIFSETGPAILPSETVSTWYLLALINSQLVKYLADAIHPGRKYEVLHLATIPFARPSPKIAGRVSSLAKKIWSHKQRWDKGNEVCSLATAPWLIQGYRGSLLVDFPELLPANQPTNQLIDLLGYVQAVEKAADTRLQQLQTKIDEAFYDLYEISVEDQSLIKRELDDRPPELIWPQMGSKSNKEKRREHVRRLLSYFLMEPLTEKRDGIIPLTPGTGHPTALDVVRAGLEAAFGVGAAFQMETDIRKELGREIKTWLNRDYWKWHIKLYKRRPMIWHLASPGNHFACFLHIHKLDGDTLRKVQTKYLWYARRSVQSELESAKDAQKRGESGASSRVDKAETVLEDLAQFERRLLSVIQAEVECDIPDWAQGPFRNGVYDPVLDDGVKVNITPLQEAGLLRVKKVV